MKIWKIVFVLLTAFSLASCDKEDENNMMLTAIESIASTQWSLNRQATHREGKTVIEKFDTESAYRYVYDFRETDYQIICYHTDGTMTSVVERGTYTYDAMRRVLTLVDADGFAKYYSVSSNKAYQLSLRQTLGDTTENGITLFPRCSCTDSVQQRPAMGRPRSTRKDRRTE